MTIRIHNWDVLAAEERSALLRRPGLHANGGLLPDVSGIVEQVRRHGDQALIDLTRRFDGVELQSLRVTDAEFAAAESELFAAAVAAIELSIANVRRFHEAQRPTGYALETMPGVRCEWLSHPIQSVGLYVPAGSAPLPSTAIMLAVPAALAGCPRRVLCTPPRADGRADAAVLVAARRAGVEEVYKVGGAQAIAALAYGTATIPAVDKIFGPGNAWVTAAKSLIAADMEAGAIDMAAGPSEVLVIADGQANAAFVAADLLSQAEHGRDSQIVLVTDDAELARRVIGEVETQLPSLCRRQVAAAAIDNCRFIATADLETAVQISNDYAPEHLIVQTADPRALLPAILNAGSVFLGPWSPESAGDYCSGTNHVLPTYGQARSMSGLGVEQFLRHMTVQELSRDGLRSMSSAVMQLAELEGLDAHAAAVSRRLADTEAEPVQ